MVQNFCDELYYPIFGHAKAAKSLSESEDFLQLISEDDRKSMAKMIISQVKRPNPAKKENCNPSVCRSDFAWKWW